MDFIMGGTGTHFDENVVRAFLRKVAPYPTGSHVILSNHEEATVLKNYPEQPCCWVKTPLMICVKREWRSLVSAAWAVMYVKP